MKAKSKNNLQSNYKQDISENIWDELIILIQNVKQICKKIVFRQ